MKVKEFKHYLNRGLGKAIIILKAHPEIASRYSNAILFACTHNTSYDPQCEDSREKYLYEIISLTKEKEILEKRIIEALSKTDNLNYDTSQMLRLAKVFAENGNSSARQAIYDKFLRTLQGKEYVGADEILELDGEEGLVFVANTVGERILSDLSYEENDWFLNGAFEMFGEEKTMNILTAQAEAQKAVQVYLEAVDRYKRQDSIQSITSEVKSYSEIKERISKWKSKDKMYAFHEFRAWGKKANQEDLEAAAMDFMKENDPSKLKCYMSIFLSRDFPLELEKIIDIARQMDGILSSIALRILQRYKDKEVHKLAIELIDSKEDINPDVLDLFINNYTHSDLKYIEKVFNKKNNEFDYHGMGLSIIHIFENRKSKKCQGIMLELYNNGQCSSCREWFIDVLIDNDVLPDWVANECLNDCNLDTRRKAEEYLNRKS